jgi:tetratricopeptide (TPR) repeat protein
MRLFRRGELDRVAPAAEAALALGEAAGDQDALAYYGAHLLSLRWAHGRMGEMVDLVEWVLESSTLRRRDLSYAAVLACATAVRGDHEAARALIDGILSDCLDQEPQLSTWTAVMMTLAEAASELGDADLAQRVADRFAPYAQLPVMPSLAVPCLGPGERVLGVAYATAGRLDEAVSSFRAALTANRRLRNRPVDVILRAELAATLVRRAAAGDVEEAAELFAAAISEGRRLGLVDRVRRWEADAAAIPSPGLPAEPVHGLLERRGDTWRLAVDGRSATVEALTGMRHIASLVQRPDAEFAATDLAASPGECEIRPSRIEPALDERALREIRRRLAELEAELDAADQSGDAERSRRATLERDGLVASLRRDTGLGGRPRRLTDEAERARARVTKAIRRALARLGEADPVLGRTMQRSIRTGYSCSYVTDPDQPIRWTVRTSDG